jgi:two-component system alkaline phosphatase synthesis response regulator PhoP
MSTKVLVVDDNKNVRDLLCSFLTRSGYEVILASSGEEAIRLANSEIPNAILLDVEMLGIDGIETCRILRAEEKTRYIPVIIMTGLGYIGTIKSKVSHAGANDLVNKPFSLSELVIRLKSVLRIGHITDQAERLMAYMDELEKNRLEYLSERNGSQEGTAMKEKSFRERRTDKRYKIRCPLHIHTASGLRRARTEDISLGGAFVHCAKPPSPNEKVLLTFENPSGSKQFVLAKVAWTNLETEGMSDKPIGMGLQFIQFHGTPRPWKNSKE